MHQGFIVNEQHKRGRRDGGLRGVINAQPAARHARRLQCVLRVGQHIVQKAGSDAARGLFVHRAHHAHQLVHPLARERREEQNRRVIHKL